MTVRTAPVSASRRPKVARRAPQAPGWKAPLLVVAADGPRTMVAAGRIEAGSITWKLPAIPLAG